PVQCEQPILDAEHRRRVDRFPLEYPVDQLAAFGQSEDLWQRSRRWLALEPLDRARRKHDHPVRALTTQGLLPAEGSYIDPGPIDRLRESGGRCVAYRK